jgi:hypothetical protein
MQINEKYLSRPLLKSGDQIINLAEEPDLNIVSIY